MNHEQRRVAIKEALLASVSGITAAQVAQVAREGKSIQVSTGLRAGSEPFVKVDYPGIIITFIKHPPTT
jgi:hypothetical protein